jgi:hypothetical protein
MDLPGKEDIKTTYVDYIEQQEEKKNSPPKANSEICVNLQPELTNKYNIQSIRAAIFLNPLFISLFPDISTKLVEFVKTNTELKGNKEFTDYKVSTVTKNHEYKENKTIEKLITMAESDIDSEISNYAGRRNSDQSVTSNKPSYIKNFNTCLAASEIMRYFIDKNKIDLIIKFLDTMIDTKTCTNPSTISFEGFYINENILGLVNTLKGRLSPDRQKAVVDDKMLMSNFFSDAMGQRMVTDEQQKLRNLYESETVAQTYFIRDLLRSDLDDKRSNLLLDDGKQLLEGDYPQYNINGVDLSRYANTLYKGESLKHWFENSYDFNKSYTTEPPIATFMKAYFDYEDAQSTIDVINNFYLFYVVSNNDIKKCANQIKLVSDSNNLIEIINNFGK